MKKLMKTALYYIIKLLILKKRFNVPFIINLLIHETTEKYMMMIKLIIDIKQ